MDIIEKEQYVPNHAARSMAMRRTKTAGLIIPRVSFLYHQQILRHIEPVMEYHDYRLIVGSVEDDSDEEVSYVRLMREKKVDGIILMHETKHSRTVETLARQGVPIVLASVHLPNTSFVSVGIDEYRAAYDGTEYLIGLGHTNIGYIGGPGPFLSEQRRSGFKAAMEAHGLFGETGNVEDGQFTIDGGRSATRRILERNRKLTALFVASDEMAIGAIRAIHDLNLRVPDHISVLGFDGIQLGEFVVPSLSTVSQPIDNIGTRAAEILIATMEGEKPKEEMVTVPHTIIERESTAGSIRRA